MTKSTMEQMAKDMQADLEKARLLREEQRRKAAKKREELDKSADEIINTLETIHEK